MCIACNVAEQTSVEVMYIGAQTDSGTSMIVPLVNNLFEMHTFQVIESFLIQASLIGFLL
jgi:hypothetical protein